MPTMNAADRHNFALTAEAGDYFARYSDGEPAWTEENDPGNRCGYGDVDLDEVRATLRGRDLTLSADDEGLIVEEVAS